MKQVDMGPMRPFIHNRILSLVCCSLGLGGLSNPKERSGLMQTHHSIDLSYRVFWTLHSSFRQEAQNYNSTIVQQNFVDAIRALKNLEVCVSYPEAL